MPVGGTFGSERDGPSESDSEVKKGTPVYSSVARAVLSSLSRWS